MINPTEGYPDREAYRRDQIGKLRAELYLYDSPLPDGTFMFVSGDDPRWLSQVVDEAVVYSRTEEIAANPRVLQILSWGYSSAS